MKLISMTDFILKQEKECVPVKLSETINPIFHYAHFLKQPLKLSMFVPCDLEGNPLKNPMARDEDAGSEKEFLQTKYNNAEQKVLFEEWVLITEWYGSHLIAKNKYGECQFNLKNYIDIEHILLDIDLELTESAIKQIGL